MLVTSTTSAPCRRRLTGRGTRPVTGACSMAPTWPAFSHREKPRRWLNGSVRHNHYLSLYSLQNTLDCSISLYQSEYLSSHNKDTIAFFSNLIIWILEAK